MSTDEHLLAEFRSSRSEQAFAELVRRHAGLVMRTALRLLGNMHEAEDVMQAVFLVLAQKPASVDRSVAGWLHEVARRTSMKLHRARSRRCKHEATAARQSTFPYAVRVAESVTDIRQEIDAALAKLPEKMREAVILRYLEGREQEEAARMVGCPRTTLAARSAEGLHRLHTLLSRRGVGVSAGVLAAFLAQEAAASTIQVVTLAAGSATAASTAVPGSTAALAHSAAKGLALVKMKVFTAFVVVASTIGVLTPLALPTSEAKWQALIVERATLKGHAREVGTVAFSPDGTWLATGSYDGNAKLWDLATGQERFHLRGTAGSLHRVAFSPDSKVLATAASSRTAQMWDVATGKERPGFQPPALGRGSFVSFSPDSKLLASAVENDVKLWDLTTGQEWATLRGHTAPVNPGSTFAPDGVLLATGSYDCTVRLWDIAQKQPLQVLRSHSGCVPCLSFSPDGRLLASASWDRTVKIWDVATGKELRTLHGHSKEVGSVAYSPDGLLLASGSFDRTVKLWDATTGQELATLTGHSSMVWRVAFSPDGKTLASASADRTVKLWGRLTP